EQEVSRDEPRRNRTGGCFRDQNSSEEDGALVGEKVELHPGYLLGRRRFGARGGLGRVRAGGRLFWIRQGGLLDEPKIPVLDETVMGVELQIPVLAAVELHDLRARPAGA